MQGARPWGRWGDGDARPACGPGAHGGLPSGRPHRRVEERPRAPAPPREGTPDAAAGRGGGRGGGEAGGGCRGRPCREPAPGAGGPGAAMSRQAAVAPGEEGKGSGPVEPDALTTGAGAAAEERIATGGGGERPPPFSRAPGPGAIAIAARSGSGVGGSGPGVVLTTGSGLKGGRGVCRWLRGS